MKYLEAKFTVGPPAKSTACERCVYGRGRHARWCEHGKEWRLIGNWGDGNSWVRDAFMKAIKDGLPQEERWFVPWVDAEWAKPGAEITGLGGSWDAKAFREELKPDVRLCREHFSPRPCWRCGEEAL